MNAPQPYTPPERSTSFVAYSRATLDTPDDNGQVQQFRSQVFVREFPTVIVKEHKSTTLSGRGGSTFETTSFTFDAASTGIPNFQHDFYASLAADDPGHDLLLAAEQRQEPVMVVLETVRKPKSDDGDKIDPHTPIHELRGAQSDGAKANSNITKQHCKNLIAGVGAAGRAETFIVTGEATSVSDEWSLLRNNKEGSFAPPGWRPAAGGLMGVTETRQADSAQPAAVDVAAVAAAVADLLAPIMRGDQGGRPRPTRQQTFSSEAKPWESWNSDGRVNASGYVVSKDRATFSYAWQKVLGLGLVTNGDVAPYARRLTQLLLWLADRVHLSVVGNVARHARTAKSHFEAAMWVQFVIDQVSITEEACALTCEVLESKDASAAWARAVEARATQLFGDSLRSVENYLNPPENTQPTPTDGSPTDSQTESPVTAEQEPTTRPASGDASNVEAEPATDQPGPAEDDSPSPAAGRPADPWEEAQSTAPESAADLGHEYLEFLGRVVDWGPQHPDRFQPLLQQHFGAKFLRDIPKDAFTAQMEQWDASAKARADFYAAARAAATPAAADASAA